MVKIGSGSWCSLCRKLYFVAFWQFVLWKEPLSVHLNREHSPKTWFKILNFNTLRQCSCQCAVHKYGQDKTRQDKMDSICYIHYCTVCLMMFKLLRVQLSHPLGVLYFKMVLLHFKSLLITSTWKPSWHPLGAAYIIFFARYRSFQSFPTYFQSICTRYGQPLRFT